MESGDKTVLFYFRQWLSEVVKTHHWHAPKTEGRSWWRLVVLYRRKPTTTTVYVVRYKGLPKKKYIYIIWLFYLFFVLSSLQFSEAHWWPQGGYNPHFENCCCKILTTVLKLSGSCHSSGVGNLWWHSEPDCCCPGFTTLICRRVAFNDDNLMYDKLQFFLLILSLYWCLQGSPKWITCLHLTLSHSLFYCLPTISFVLFHDIHKSSNLRHQYLCSTFTVPSLSNPVHPGHSQWKSQRLHETECLIMTDINGPLTTALLVAVPAGDIPRSQLKFGLIGSDLILLVCIPD